MAMLQFLPEARKQQFLRMRSENMVKNTGKCLPIAKTSLPESKYGSPNPKEVAQVLNL